MKIFYSSHCLEYGMPSHPESPARVSETVTFLTENGYSFETPEPCTDEDILRVHAPEMLEALEASAFLDGDTPALPHIVEFAKLSAGAAIQSAQAALLDGFAFSLMRPPGHHATTSRIMGFCYLNNIAIAVSHHIEHHPDQKVAILDIDCHHGNGTEDIFLGHPSVLFVSLHQVPLYPGTGLESKENVINFPLAPGTGEKEYLDALERACRDIADFRPSLLGISAGFDSFAQDPLTHLSLEIETYRRIGETIAALNLPSFAVLEGGYSPQLPECIHRFIQGMMPSES